MALTLPLNMSALGTCLLAARKIKLNHTPIRRIQEAERSANERYSGERIPLFGAHTFGHALKVPRLSDPTSLFFGLRHDKCFACWRAPHGSLAKSPRPALDSTACKYSAENP